MKSKFDYKLIHKVYVVVSHIDIMKQIFIYVYRIKPGRNYNNVFTFFYMLQTN